MSLQYGDLERCQYRNPDIKTFAYWHAATIQDRWSHGVTPGRVEDEEEDDESPNKATIMDNMDITQNSNNRNVGCLGQVEYPEGPFGQERQRQRKFGELSVEEENLLGQLFGDSGCW